MKLKAPNFGPAHRARLEKTKTWMIELRDKLLEKSREVDDLKSRLKAAEASRAEYSSKAALDADAAMRMAGADTQIRLLSPIVRQQESSLNNDIEVAGKQVGTVRKDDLGKLLWPPLSEQIISEVKAALAPFFAEHTLNGAAQLIAGESVTAKCLASYTNRRAPNVPDVETAVKWLSATADEIEDALSGETIITIDPLTDTFTYPDSRAIERHSIDIAA